MKIQQLNYCKYILELKAKNDQYFDDSSNMLIPILCTQKLKKLLLKNLDNTYTKT